MPGAPKAAHWAVSGASDLKEPLLVHGRKKALVGCRVYELHFHRPRANPESRPASRPSAFS